MEAVLFRGITCDAGKEEKIKKPIYSYSE